MRDAAGLIESLQTQLASYQKYGEPSDWRIMKQDAEEISKLKAENIDLAKMIVESQRRERAAVEDIVSELIQMMEIQIDNEEMYRQRGEKDMEEYAHAKYMGLHDAKCMIINNDWRGPKKDCKTCIYLGGTCAGMAADENFDCRNWRGAQAGEGGIDG
jgi:hypothetical protein